MKDEAGSNHLTLWFALPRDTSYPLLTREGAPLPCTTNSAKAFFAELRFTEREREFGVILLRAVCGHRGWLPHIGTGQLLQHHALQLVRFALDAQRPCIEFDIICELGLSEVSREFAWASSVVPVSVKSANTWS